MNKKTPHISISTKTTYLSKHSDPKKLRFVWSYEISILNNSNQIYQLLQRLWHITDLTAKVEEVRGLGVVGLQPLLKPQKVFTYSSFCQLMTPQGTMAGEYEIQDLDEYKYIIEIPKFVLCAPQSLTQAFRSLLH